MNNIIIDNEFQVVIPPIRVEEYASLEASIIENGFDSAYPIIIGINNH